MTLTDLGSTNGTFRWDTDDQRWDRVLPNQTVVLQPGTPVALGRVTFVFETVARST